MCVRRHPRVLSSQLLVSTYRITSVERMMPTTEPLSGSTTGTWLKRRLIITAAAAETCEGHCHELAAARTCVRAGAHRISGRKCDRIERHRIADCAAKNLLDGRLVRLCLQVECGRSGRLEQEVEL